MNVDKTITNMQAFRILKLKLFLYANLEIPYQHLHHQDAKIVLISVVLQLLGVICFQAHFGISAGWRRMHAWILAGKIFTLAVLCHVLASVVLLVNNVLVVAAVFLPQLL
jgi:hypothetical protein